VSHAIPYGPVGEESFTEFSAVSETQVTNILNSLDTSKAAGSDGIPPRLLRGCSEILAPSLTHLLNTSLLTGELPEGFKVAHIVPLLKSTKLDATQPSNYRGISLLPIISKVLEKIVKQQLERFLENNSALSDFQFGFRHGISRYFHFYISRVLVVQP